jgi:hypothetical protein
MPPKRTSIAFSWFKPPKETIGNQLAPRSGLAAADRQSRLALAVDSAGKNEPHKGTGGYQGELDEWPVTAGSLRGCATMKSVGHESGEVKYADG